MKRILSLLVLLASPLMAQNAQQRIDWNKPAAPFRLIGNVHYVGTEGLSAYLITDPKGHVLIDGGLPESAPLIAANVARLGFRMRDVRYLLINHAHYDHSGGLAELKRASGARLVASAGDAPDLAAGRTIGRPELDSFPPVKVDRIVGQGATVTVGGTRLVAQMTPGHTKGCTSWSTTTRDPAVRGGRPISVLFACSITTAGQPLTGTKEYPNAAADFRATFARLDTIKADVFLNFHPEFFNLVAKRARLSAGHRAAFVDAAELPKQLAKARAGFEAELARQTKAQ